MSSPYRIAGDEPVIRPDPREMPQWLAKRRWFRRLLGGRWELWWCGVWPVDAEPEGLRLYEYDRGVSFYRPVGYYAWFRVGEWNVPNELRRWARYRRVDRFAVEQVGFWEGLGDVTIAREDWTR